MTPFDALFLFLAAMFGGALNSIAGGGTFLVFPVLLFTGMNPIAANATCTMALWPGTIASAWAYRGQLAQQLHHIPLLFAISLLGGIAGSLTLLVTPEKIFTYLIPYLLLGATLLFTFGTHAIAWLRAHIQLPESWEWLRKGGSLALQFIIAFYGGYFGAGIGILMLALLSLLGHTKIHEMNAMKTTLGGAINGVAVIIFIVAGAVVWPQALLMLVAAIIGGYGGAHYAQKLPHHIVRWMVIATGTLMTLYFFLK